MKILIENFSHQFWVSNLVCPQCNGKLFIINSNINCEICQKHYSIIDGVPCFIDRILSEHQKSELRYYLNIYGKNSFKENFYNQTEVCYKWATKWINVETVQKDTKIICIGGSYGDDLPHVKSNFKFNVDHLAHQYIKMFPGIIKANVKHIASKSENLPFKDNYADIIYSRNSLDHVNNPIKTLLEINRVLKPEGKFFLSVYYNSNFINSHESTSIDDEFVKNHLKNLFEVEFIKIDFIGKKAFSLPNAKKLGWLYAVLKKKQEYISYNNKILESYEKLLSNFHSAIYYDEERNFNEASKYFYKVINAKPFLGSDEMRRLYSRIKYLAITNQKAFKNFFDEFKKENKDPFWWEVIIDSSRVFMRKYLEKHIKSNFSYKTYLYLLRYIRIKKYKWLNMNGFKNISEIFQSYCQIINYFLKQHLKINLFFQKILKKRINSYLLKIH